MVGYNQAYVGWFIPNHHMCYLLVSKLMVQLVSFYSFIYCIYLIFFLQFLLVFLYMSQEFLEFWISLHMAIFSYKSAGPRRFFRVAWTPGDLISDLKSRGYSLCNDVSYKGIVIPLMCVNRAPIQAVFHQALLVMYLCYCAYCHIKVEDVEVEKITVGRGFVYGMKIFLCSSATVNEKGSAYRIRHYGLSL